MIRPLDGSPNLPQYFPGQAATSQAYVKGQLLYRSSGTLIPADGTNDKTINIEGICNQSFTAAGSGNPTVTYYPIMPGMLYIVDCTNTTALNQLHVNQAMTDSLHVANTSTPVTTDVGHFVPIALGPTTTQLIGYFCKLGQKAS